VKSTWRSINENAGTIILRAVCALVAIALCAALVVVGWKGIASGDFAPALKKILALVTGITLFGGYALFANRLVVRKFDAGGDVELGVDPPD
jgi:hypothetical protein